MGIWLGPMGGNGIGANDFTFTGQSSYTSSGGYWEIALTGGENATLVFLKPPGAVDIFLVAGGKTGGKGGGNAYGGRGGAGGELKTIPGVALEVGVSYGVTVGASDKDSKFTIPGGTEYIAQSGQGQTGGRGGQCGDSGNVTAGAGSDGSLAFNGNDCLSFPGRKFGASGGGGGCTSSGYDSKNPAKGGETGAGKGGDSYGSPGVNATANTGSGGGGQGYNAATSKVWGPGSGGSGVILIRGTL